MAKLRTSFTLSAETLAKLERLAKANSRSKASMLEVLVKEADAKSPAV